MKSPAPCEIWYVTGSQHLYGEEALIDKHFLRKHGASACYDQR